MAPTRRSLLTTAGVAMAAKFLKPSEAQAQGQPSGQTQAQPPGTKAQSGSPRGLTLCNLRSGLGVKQGDRILEVAKAGQQLKVAVPASTDEVIAGKHADGLRKVVQARRRMPPSPRARRSSRRRS